MRRGGSLGILYGGEVGYSGTAHAVFANSRYIEAQHPKHVLILAADHVYQMDFRKLVREHEASGAGVTIAATDVPLEDARSFGVIGTDESGRINSFIEKPRDPQPMPGKTALALASMGIYVFTWAALKAALAADAGNPDSTHDFGKDILPRFVEEGQAQVHLFSQPPGSKVIRPYWRDVGTLDSLLLAHEEYLRHGDAVLDFAAWPVGIHAEALHPHWPMRRATTGSPASHPRRRCRIARVLTGRSSCPPRVSAVAAGSRGPLSPREPTFRTAW